MICKGNSYWSMSTCAVLVCWYLNIPLSWQIKLWIDASIKQNFGLVLQGPQLTEISSGSIKNATAWKYIKSAQKCRTWLLTVTDNKIRTGRVRLSCEVILCLDFVVFSWRHENKIKPLKKKKMNGIISLYISGHSCLCGEDFITALKKWVIYFTSIPAIEATHALMTFRENVPLISCLTLDDIETTLTFVLNFFHYSST